MDHHSHAMREDWDEEGALWLSLNGHELEKKTPFFAQESNLREVASVPT